MVVFKTAIFIDELKVHNPEMTKFTVESFEKDENKNIIKVDVISLDTKASCIWGDNRNITTIGVEY